MEESDRAARNAIKLKFQPGFFPKNTIFSLTCRAVKEGADNLAGPVMEKIAELCQVNVVNPFCMGNEF